jgi:type IV pilus secretin PilQ/predicted competence protein
MSRLTSLSNSWINRRLPLGLTAAAALAVCAGQTFAQAGVPAGSGDDQSGGVEVSEYMTVDIFVQDESLSNVLQALAVETQKNIVASPDVRATVTANLFGVTFYEALDAILLVNGFAYEEKGNFIYVYTQAEYEAIKAAQRKTAFKVIQLNYLNAEDAALFVQPLLSEVGELKANASAAAWAITDGSPSGAEDFALSATLVVYDYEENIAKIEEVVQSLDTRPSQVLVEATILQTTLNEANAFGVDFSMVGNIDFSDFFGVGGPLGIANAIAGDESTVGDSLQTVQSTAGNFRGGSANFRAALFSDDVGVFIRALDSVSDTTILSNPKILALNRMPARVLVGRKLGYLSTTSTETSTTQTVEFLDTGTQLAFRPFISNEGIIRLEIAPRVSEGVVNTRTDVEGVAITVPDEITQELNTNIAVPDGSTVVLGGLFKETTSAGRSQVPVLGDIPIIGAAFRGHDDSIDRQEVIFMLTPTIMNDNVLLAQGEQGVEWTERVRVGSRNGTLPFSRERQTAQLNVQAERLAREGEYDRAMHLLRRSLELHPHQPDALRLREQLMNQTDFWPKRSLLDAMINDEVGVRFQAPPQPEADENPSPMGKADTSNAPFDGPEQELASESGSESDGPVADDGTADSVDSFGDQPEVSDAEVASSEQYPGDEGSFGEGGALNERNFNAPGELESIADASASGSGRSSQGSTDPVTAELEAYLAQLRNQTSPFAEVEDFSDRGSFESEESGAVAEGDESDSSSEEAEVQASELTELPQRNGFFLNGSGPLAYFPAIWNMPMSFFTPEFWASQTENEVESPDSESDTEITEVDVDLDN